ncbi:MAG: HAD hydrolase family protein [Oscillospiraceae bacterium]|nr:HAD hydrolase family protein [Oscillospiraceae bacterium]
MIKLIVCDVDGTLTDSLVIYSDGNIESKAFSTKDGLILKVLPKLGISVVFLTGRTSEAVFRRAADLGATAICGISDKLPALHELLSSRGILPEECAYIGDDLNDYAAMTVCGFKGAPSDAAADVRQLCDYVSPFKGGYGAVRDVCEQILKRDGKYEEFLRLFTGSL